MSMEEQLNEDVPRCNPDRRRELINHVPNLPTVVTLFPSAVCLRSIGSSTSRPLVFRGLNVDRLEDVAKRLLSKSQKLKRLGVRS